MRLTVKAHEAFVLLCKKPAFFCQSVADGEVLELADDLAQALLAQYPRHLHLADEPAPELKRVRREKA